MKKWNWKKQRWLLIGVALVSALAIWLLPSKHGEILRYGDTELLIPERYMSEFSSPWGWFMYGLDDGSRSININIGVQETYQLLPKHPYSISGGKRSLHAVISIMKPEEMQRFANHDSELARQLRERSGEFSKYVHKEEPLIGWRIYPGDVEDKNHWFLFRKEPHEVQAEDFIAQCYSSEPGSFNTCGLDIGVGNVHVAIDVDLEDLNREPQIRQYFTDLVNGWRQPVG